MIFLNLSDGRSQKLRIKWKRIERKKRQKFFVRIIFAMGMQEAAEEIKLEKVRVYSRK